MAIENRNLSVGTRLVARYKKRTYLCTVVETEGGVRYRLEDGREYKSPSAAGSAVQGGQACNGWRFWSLVGDVPVAEAEGEERPAARERARQGRASRIIRKTPNQTGTSEGQTRYFCAGCGESYFAPSGAAPEACPKGHRAELDGNGDLVVEAPVVDETPAGDDRDEPAEAAAATTSEE